jgi:hypothetical protein
MAHYEMKINTHSGGGLQNYYKLTPLGFEFLYGPTVPQPSRAFFEVVSPSLLAHTFRLAEVIVATLRACSAHRIVIDRFFRENELTFTAGQEQVQPDCFFRLLTSGRAFNLAFEIDNSMSSIEAPSESSIEGKLKVYDAYQELMLSRWLSAGKNFERPRFRVVFLTPSVARAYHILAQAAKTTRHPLRRLVYASTHDAYLTDLDPLLSPLFLDHRGSWQSLIDLHPTARYLREPVRLPSPVECPLGV